MSVERHVRNGRRRYDVRWREGGRQRSRSFDRREDAERFEADARRRVQLGAFGPGEPSRMGFGEWLEVWYSRGEVRWARSTRLHRAAILDKWIVPYLAGERLCDLAPARVREWQAGIRADGCSAKQANQVLRVLSAILGAAVEDDLLPMNPVSRVKRYPTARPRPRALDPGQVEAIRAAMARARDRALWSLLAYAGLRPEEALALRWADVRDHTIVVDRAYAHGEEKPTKTYQRRTVEVMAPLRADLEAARPAGARPADLVAPALGRADRPAATPVNAFLDLGNWRSRIFKPASGAAGIEANPYDGRHSYASLLIHSGRSPLAVAAALGHASAETTWKHYAHLFDEARLASSTDPEEAIRAARAEVLSGSGVRPECDEASPRRLRLVAPSRGSAA